MLLLQWHLPDLFHPSRCWQTQIPVHWAVRRLPWQWSSKGREQPQKNSGYDYSWLLLHTDWKLRHSCPPVLQSGWLAGQERDHEPSFRRVLWPRWEQPCPSLTQRLGPAAPGASTPERNRQGLRSGDILGQRDRNPEWTYSSHFT